MITFKIYLSFVFLFLKNIVYSTLLGVVTAFQVLYLLVFFNHKRLFFERHDLSNLNSVLVISPDNKIGDNVINSFFLKSLRSILPKAYIVLIHNSSTIPLYENCPHINKRVVISFDMKSINSLLFRLKYCGDFFKKNFPETSFDVAFIPRWDDDFFSPFLMWFSLAKHRVGFSRKVNLRKAIRNLGTDFFYTNCSLCLANVHEVNKSLMLLEDFFQEKIDISMTLESYRSENDDLLAYKFLSDFRHKEIIAISPGAADLKRKWPLNHFIDLINRVLNFRDVHIVLLGSEVDYDECCTIIDSVGSDSISNFSGLLSIQQSASVISISNLYIGNDSGLIHIASSVATSVVEISCHHIGADPGGSNSPLRYGPVGVDKIVLQPHTYNSFLCRHGCVAEFSHCIKNVSVQDVFNATLLMMA
jgi:heptosyltransferase-2